MSDKQPASNHASTRTTGNEPIEAIDPGGTRSTKPGQPDKTKPNAQDPKVEHQVVSGDRNVSRESRGPHPQGD